MDALAGLLDVDAADSSGEKSTWMWLPSGPRTLIWTEPEHRPCAPRSARFALEALDEAVEAGGGEREMLERQAVDLRLPATPTRCTWLIAASRARRREGEGWPLAAGMPRRGRTFDHALDVVVGC